MSFHFRFAETRPATLDPEARTIEAIASTGAETARPGFRERLDLDGANLDRLIGGPVLDAHNSRSTRDQLGIVEAAEVRPEGLWVRLRFRGNAGADAVLADIGEGTIRGLSIGYTVQRWEETREDGERIRTAVEWTPMEVSVVPIPADPGAHFRAAGEVHMEQQTTENTAAEGEAREARSAGEAREARAAVNREIRQIAETAGLTREWADEQIDAAATVEEARAAAFEAMRERSAATPTRTQRAHVGASADDPHTRAERAGEALFARLHPEHDLAPAARGFAGMTPRDLAADCLRAAGAPTTGLSTDTIITRALHSTGDFPLILGNAVGRELRRAYEAAPSGARRLARQTAARDFRARSAVVLGEGPTLEKVPENGQYEYGTIAEGAESYSVETFGKIVGVTRQALVNDDLGAFQRVPAMLGMQARAFEDQQIAQLIEANPTMADGVAVFDAAHGNLAGTGGAPSEATLSAARLLMRQQTGLQGALINVLPRFMLVPPALETDAEKLLSSIQATTTADVNPFAALELVVEPRLTSSTAWYLVADPAAADGVEFAYLEGAPGPQIEQRVGFNVDGLEIKVRLDFGAGWIDHRAWAKNEGA